MIPDIIFAINTNLKAKINEVKNKISNINKLGTAIALPAVENKIPNHNKCIYSPELNKLPAKYFAARLAQASLPNKNDIANFVKKDKF